MESGPYLRWVRTHPIGFSPLPNIAWLPNISVCRENQGIPKGLGDIPSPRGSIARDRFEARGLPVIRLAGLSGRDSNLVGPSLTATYRQS